MADLVWRDDDFQKRVGRLLNGIDDEVHKAIGQVADEVLRLSIIGPPAQVPHDEGTLQGTGVSKPIGPREWRVGYNTKYAARLHEHPEFNFQKGRKGKYLEDPIKDNMPALRTKLFGDARNGIVGLLG